MAGALTGEVTTAASGRLVGELMVQWCGPHALLRHRGESGAEPWELTVVPPAPGSVLVAVSELIRPHPSLPQAIEVLLRSLCRPIAEGARAPGGRPGIRAVWLAVDHLGSAGEDELDWLRALAGELGIDVLAPCGRLTTVPGIGCHVGARDGARGWRRLRGGSPDLLHSNRFPAPDWESALPRRPVRAAGLVAELVPAGLAVRRERSAPVQADDLAHRAIGDPRHAKLVVGRPAEPPIEPAELAGLLAALPPRALAHLVLVPATPEVAGATWAAELADRLGRPVVHNTGVRTMSDTRVTPMTAPGPDGDRLFAPFPTLLWTPPGGGRPEVLDIAPAPPGWLRCGKRLYRTMADYPGVPAVLAEVVPAGLVLRSPSAGRTGRMPPFDPLGWTVGVGAPGSPVTDALLVALERLLAGLSEDRLRAVRVEVLGDADTAARTRVDAITGNAGVPLLPGAGPVRETPEAKEIAPAVPVPVALRPSPPERRPAGPGPFTARMSFPDRTYGVPARKPRPQPAPPAELPPVDEAARERPRPDGKRSFSGRIALPAPAPAAATSEPATEPERAGKPAFSGRINLPRPLPPPAPVAEETPAGTPVVTMSTAPVATSSGSPRAGGRAIAPRPAPPEEPTAPEPDPIPDAPAPDAEEPREAAADEPAEPEPANARPGTVEPDSAEPVAREEKEPLVLGDRASTAAEQGRFAAAAGDAFTDALAVVNSALATWPALRRPDATAAKADYVAVCLYLGRGPAGALRLDESLRAGRDAPFEAFLPCLVSGLRRLPTHRRAVLRQGTFGSAAARSCVPGTVLTGPGFLSASVLLDVTVPGADVDLLIWPRFARRSAELDVHRQIEEAVFLPGSRFRILGLRAAPVEDETNEAEENGPRTVVLLRELEPAEAAVPARPDARDIMTLAKLERAWQARRGAPVRPLEDPDVSARLLTPMLDATGEPLGRLPAELARSLAAPVIA